MFTYFHVLANFEYHLLDITEQQECRLLWIWNCALYITSWQFEYCITSHFLHLPKGLFWLRGGLNQQHLEVQVIPCDTKQYNNNNISIDIDNYLPLLNLYRSFFIHRSRPLLFEDAMFG